MAILVSSTTTDFSYLRDAGYVETKKLETDAAGKHESQLQMRDERLIGSIGSILSTFSVSE